MKAFAIIAVLGSVVVCAQDKPAEKTKLNARELFYTPPPAAPAKPAAAKAVAKQAPTKEAPATKQGSVNPPPVQQASKPVETFQPGNTQQNLPEPVQQAQQATSARTQTVAYSAPMPLGLRYSVLRRNDNGQFLEVDPEATFRSGDRIRLQVEANTSGYLYVVVQGSSGNWQLLFPSTDVAGGSNKVQRGETRQIPAGDRGQFVFDEQAGAEKLFIVLSRQPENDLDRLIYSMSSAPLNPKPSDTPQDNRTLLARVDVGNDVVSRLRGQLQARDLVFEKVDTPAANGRAEKAAYVVNPSTAPDARLIADITLRHQ